MPALNEDSLGATPGLGIWQQILSESTTAENFSCDGRTILVLGDRNCGKTSLLSKAKRRDLHKEAKGLAIDFTYLDVQEDDEVLTRLNVWQLEGEQDHNALLKFAINKENFHKAAVLIVLDFSRPWDLVDQLTVWLKTLSDHLQALKLTSSESQTNLVRRFTNYKEPEAGAVRKKKAIGIDLQNLNKDDDITPTIEDPEVLSKNLGVPIVVACAKVDYVEILERNYNFKEDDFEYIQQHLRRICLQYGASLLYCSTRSEFNCDLCFEYIEHLLFNFDFVHQPKLNAREDLFIPIGWDSTDKIEVDFRNQNASSDASEPFNQIIQKPSSIANQETVVPLVLSEDDQQFLERHKNAIEKKDQVKRKKDALDSKSLKSTPISSAASTPISAGGASTPSSSAVPSSTDSPAKSDIFDKLLRSPLPSTGSQVSTPVSASKLGTSSMKSSGGALEREEMKSFFNNLLKKDPK